MSKLLETRIEDLKNKFTTLNSPDERYSYLIEIGRSLPFYPENLKTADRIVPGCQSILYLSTSFENENLFFTAFSDALISAGLAALLISIYSGATPKEILLTPPTFLQELGIYSSLSPTRSSGLVGIYSKIKQHSLNILIGQNPSVS